MINTQTFEEKHIRELQQKTGNDPILIERALYAFGLLEALVRVGMAFTFKGGTCLMLLLTPPRRLSTDIDIVCAPTTDVDACIREAAKIFPFKRVEEDRRVGKNHIIKRHFKFYYSSPVTGNEFYILLDILFEENVYSFLEQKEIRSALLIIDDEPKFTVTVPKIECILGDKLTAFAPHTIGIPLNVGKELEVMKQLFDIAVLADCADDLVEVRENYEAIALNEIAYRGLGITPRDTLLDTVRGCLCVMGKGSRDKEEFPLYLKGVKAVSNHIFSDRYSGEKAAFDACRVFYLAVALLRGAKGTIRIDCPEKYRDEIILSKEYGKLSYLRKINLTAYGYLVEGIKLLEGEP